MTEQEMLEAAIRMSMESSWHHQHSSLTSHNLFVVSFFLVWLDWFENFKAFYWYGLIIGVRD